MKCQTPVSGVLGLCRLTSSSVPSPLMIAYTVFLRGFYDCYLAIRIFNGGICKKRLKCAWMG